MISNSILHNYLNILSERVSKEEEIMKINIKNKISTQFVFERDFKSIEWEANIPWFLWINTEYWVDFEYFPKSMIEWVLKLFIASQFSTINNLDDIYEGREDIVSTEEILKRLSSWQFPTLSSIDGVKIIEFTNL